MPTHASARPPSYPGPASFETLPLRLPGSRYPPWQAWPVRHPGRRSSPWPAEGPALPSTAGSTRCRSPARRRADQYLPLRVRLCAPGGTLSLGAGRHTLTAAAPGPFAVTDLSLASANPGPGTAAGTTAGTGAARTVTVRTWQPDQRRLAIGPVAASYLEIHEDDNPGWAATLNGRAHPGTPRRLAARPSSSRRRRRPVTLTFSPAATYHLVLVASLLAVVLLLAIAVWSFTPASQRAAAL